VRGRFQFKLQACERGSGFGGVERAGKELLLPQPERIVPEWAKDWYASIAPSGSVQDEVCSLYSEWMQLVQKTRGGFFFGSDPSYGGDMTGRNQRGPSHSYYDNTRYLALSKLFGRGFVPVACF